MTKAFQLDKYHINNHLGTTLIGDFYSGFNLEDQSKAACLVLNEGILTGEQVDELQRVTLILAQKENEGVLRPLAWGVHEGRHYVIYPDFGRVLSSYVNLKELPAPELLQILRKLLKALNFAESKDVKFHGFICPENIRISLERGEVKLALFGYPMIDMVERLPKTAEGMQLLKYFPPEELSTLDQPPYQYDLYAIGLIGLELATAQPADEVLPPEDRLDLEKLRERLAEHKCIPLPVQELFYKMLTPSLEERYQDFKQALSDVDQLCGEDEVGLRFRTFILDTMISGRFQLGKEIDQGRVSRIYEATDTHDEEGDKTCVVKLIDLRDYPEMSEVFHTRFKALTNIRHDHLLEVYDVGVHFENGFIAMESGFQSLEELLIKRGTLPMNDAGRVVYQLCKALEALDFNKIGYHGAIKPSNIFLSTDLRSVKLADSLTADYFLKNGNLNFIGAEYFNPEFIREQPTDIRSDIYNLGTLFFEMMVGHPPFSFKIEQEIIDDHLNTSAATRVESSLISPDCKDIILQCLEKNPALRFQTLAQLKERLTILLGYDKKEQVEIPNLFFDFAELSMVGKNTREKSEETLAIRLPAINNRARGAIALLSGHGPQLGDAAKAATSTVVAMREMLFNPGKVSPEFVKLQKSKPDEFLVELVVRLNQRLYREAFAQGKTKRFGLSAVIAMIQENTLYMFQIGDSDFTVLTQGEIVDHTDDKWTIYEETTLGDTDSALSSDTHDFLGYGEIFKVKQLKRRLQEGDQVFLLSRNLIDALSMSEIKELITSSSEPAQAVELVRSDAIRRRLEGTVSCVLLSVGNVVVFAEEGVSHSKKGMLARNFLAQGDIYLNDGRIEEAIEQYNAALEINPNFAIIHHQLGVAYVRKGLSSYGLSCFERALALNSKLPSSYVEITKILKQQRRQREVLPLLRQAVASGCKDADVYALLGRELIQVRNYDEAILYCTYALDLDGSHPTAFKNRMLATKRRNALDTKLIKLFGARQRLADGAKGTIKQSEDAED